MDRLRSRHRQARADETQRRYRASRGRQRSIPSFARAVSASISRLAERLYRLDAVALGGQDLTHQRMARCQRRILLEACSDALQRLLVVLRLEQSLRQRAIPPGDLPIAALCRLGRREHILQFSVGDLAQYVPDARSHDRAEVHRTKRLERDYIATVDNWRLDSGRLPYVLEDCCISDQISNWITCDNLAVASISPFLWRPRSWTIRSML